MIPKQRSQLGMVLGDLLTGGPNGGIAAYAAYLGCHRVSLSRALCDPHRRGNSLIECVCALLWALRERGFSPSELLACPFPADRLVDAGVYGQNDVERAFAYLFPSGYARPLADRLRHSRRALLRAMAVTEGRAYPQLRLIAQLLIVLRDQGIEPTVALKIRLPALAGPAAFFVGGHDGRLSIAV